MPYKRQLGDHPEQRDLIDFVRSLFPRYTASWHHNLIADKLMAIEAGTLSRLIITMPPRFGKSELASINFPAWYLGRNPDNRVIACSNTARLANRFSRLARNKVNHYQWAFPKVRLADDQANVESWDLQGYRGGYIAAGIGGQVTGFGADLILVDDPVKSAAQADSETYRENTWEWYTETLRTRLEPDGAIVVIGTRWHEDDLIGRLLQDTGESWEVINLPAIDDAGESLWPSRWPVSELEHIRQAVGSRAWNAQYQGQPTPAEGGILKRHWFPTYTVRPHDATVVQFWDTAYKTGTANDYSVCATIGYTRTGRYLLDVYRERLEYPDLKRMAPRLAAQWRPEAILVEDKASGQSLLQDMRRETGLPVIGVPVTKDKVARVNEMAPVIEAGRLHLPEAAPWLDDAMHELTAFPLAAHDDIVDAVIGGLAWIEARMTQQTSWGGSWLPDDDDEDRRSVWS